LICGFYGNHNLGDEAMLSGMIEMFGEEEKTHIVVLSNDPEDTRKKHDVNAIHISKRRYWSSRTLENLRCRNFILGGGDLLRDSPQSSIALNWLKYIQPALVLKRHTAVLGISVGEIWRDDTKEAIPKILNQVQLIAVRDETSKNKLEELGVKQEIHVIGDLALHAVPCEPGETKNTLDQPIQVGVSVRHLVGRGKSVDPKIYERILEEIVKATDLLVDNFQATIHFLPFRTSKNAYHATDDDYVASLEALRFSRYNSQAVLHRYFDSAQDFVSQVQKFDLVIGMRLHSLILSSAAGTPVVGIAYDTKVSSFMGEIQQSDKCILLNKVTAEAIFNNAVSIIKEPQKHKSKLIEGIRQYRDKLSAIENRILSP